MKAKLRKRPRLYGKSQPRMPHPVSAKADAKGFSLRLIGTADHRFAVVKQMRRRVETLMEEAGCDTLAKEFLAGRAVFILSFLESKELDALEGKQIDWRQYFTATRSLTDALHRLGMEREAKKAKRLQDYIVDQKGPKHGKSK